MHTNSEFEKIAIIVILSGCGLAIALAFAVLICCQLLIKPKYSRYGCADSVIVFERQTTTSDENNIDYNSGCFEDSFYTRDYNPGADSDTNPDTCVSSPNTVVAVQTHNNCMVSTTTPSSTTTSPTPTTAIAMVTTVSAAADTTTTTTSPLSQHSNGAHTPPLSLPSSSSSTTAAPLPSSSSSSSAQPLSSALPNLQQRQRSSSHQVKFSTRPPLVSTRKTSLPCKFVTICYDNKTDEIVSNDSHRKRGNNGQQRRLSAGIIRQKSFEDIEEDISYNNQQIELSERRRRNSLEDKTIDKDVLRRQYKDLWHLRTTYEAEEDESLDHQSLDAASAATAANIVVVAAVAEPADSLPIVGPQKLTKNDSGYKSIERRDYSIDYKSEYIYRQFTTQTSTAAPIVPQQQQQQQHRALSITHQQSIKEEQETDIHAVFV